MKLQRKKQKKEVLFCFRAFFKKNLDSEEKFFMITEKNYNSNKETRTKEFDNEKEKEIKIKKESNNDEFQKIPNVHQKQKCAHESKSQKTFIIKKKKPMKKKTENFKPDNFKEHFKEIIDEIEKEENGSNHDHQSDGFEEGRSDSESSSDDLEVKLKLKEKN